MREHGILIIIATPVMTWTSLNVDREIVTINYGMPIMVVEIRGTLIMTQRDQNVEDEVLMISGQGNLTMTVETHDMPTPNSTCQTITPHRGDKEWDGVYDKRDSPSGSRKHSSSESSRRHSHELLPTSSKTVTVTSGPSSIDPGCRVPGLWFVKVGLDHMDILDMTFEVDAEVASRCRPENGSKITVRLVCLPTASVEETYKQLDPAASQELVTDAMRQIQTVWPPKGKVIIEMNPSGNVGRSWLPQDLDPAGPPLELTEHIRPGQNSIRLIHLGDLSGHTFLLHASEARASLLPAQKPNPKPISTQQLVDSDWDNCMTRLKAKPTEADVRVGAFSFAGTVTVQPQTV